MDTQDISGLTSFPVVTPPDQPEVNQRTGQQDILPFAVKNRNVDTITWDKGFGGSLTLGGFNNKNGVLYIKDANKNTIIKGDNLGHHYYNTSGNELVRVDWVGLKTFNTSAVKLSQFDATGAHFYDASANELVRVDNVGLKCYNTSAQQLSQFDATGAHFYDGASHELSRYDSTGAHFYDGSAHELARLDSTGFHTYNVSAQEITKSSDTGYILRNTRGMFFEETTPLNFASIAMDGSNIFYMKAGQTTNNIWFEDKDGLTWFRLNFDASSQHQFDCRSIFSPYVASADPSATTEGGMYYNSTLHALRIYQNVGGILGWHTVNTT